MPYAPNPAVSVAFRLVDFYMMPRAQISWTAAESLPLCYELIIQPESFMRLASIAISIIRSCLSYITSRNSSTLKVSDTAATADVWCTMRRSGDSPGLQ